MSESNSDIIDIPPENVVEHKVEPPKHKAASRAGNSRLLQLSAVSALVIAAAIGGGWAYRDLLSSYFPSDNVQALAQQVAGLDGANKDLAKKLEAIVGVTDEIKSQSAAAQSAAEDWKRQLGTIKTADEVYAKSISGLEATLADAQSQLKTLQEKVDALPASGSATGTVDTSQLEQRLAAVEKDLGALKAGVGGAVDTAALNQSLTDLKGKIAEGSGFAPELETIKRSVPAAEGLDVLAKFARSGVANAKTLEAELAKAAGELPKPEATSTQKDESWSGWFSNLFSSVISIRVEGEPDWHILAQKAQAFMASGDLAQASAVFDNQATPLPESLKQWHEAAAARLQLDAAFEKVSAAVSRQIAAKG
jgi:hypothetical protein